jgi:formate/nitrite transporter FocA (FNT family)
MNIDLNELKTIQVLEAPNELLEKIKLQIQKKENKANHIQHLTLSVASAFLICLSVYIARNKLNNEQISNNYIAVFETNTSLY